MEASVTGINHFWTYEEHDLAGIGRYMVNIANGNLLVQSDDVDIHERGIDLAFRRTYNSLSQHDYNDSDGSVASNFGNGWTNTFDAHIAYQNNGSAISVYDIDGTRYDYSSNGAGAWLPPPGMQGTSLTLATSNGYSNSCYYQWTKRNGSAYIFYAPDYASRTCRAAGAGVGLNGRIAEITGRNSNNYVLFTYGWQNGVVDSSHLGSITVAHADGHQLLLSFALTNGTSPCDGTGPCELQSITRPDSQAITYDYDADGNLTQVNLPGNNVNNTLWENYSYNSGHQLAEVSNPRYAYSYMQTGGVPTEGSTTVFQYYGTGQLQFAQLDGVVNFVPSDDTGLVLQSGMPTGVQAYYQQNFSGYNAASCEASLVTNSYGSFMSVTTVGSGATTTVTDSDGHKTQYSVDGCWRLVQTSAWPNPTAQVDLVTTEVWDANDNLIQSVDARGNTTDYEYDVNGNTTIVAKPMVTTTSGTFRPTEKYSYDAHNNVVAYCDPVFTHQSGGDWTTSPGYGEYCSSQSGAAHISWDTSDPAELFGRLSDTYTAAGYHEHYSYDPSQQSGCDCSLPTTVQGDSTPQSDGTTLAPVQAFQYDPYGNIAAYTKISSQITQSNAWHLSYDSLNRLTSVADPDGVTSYKYYFLNGQIQKTESSYQHATGTGDVFSYDADGDEIAHSKYVGGSYVAGTSPTLPTTSATTAKYYDGADRLVEVVEPQDSNSDAYQNAPATRYLYDLSQNGLYQRPSYGGLSITAYGNLAKTQELLPANSIVSITSTTALPIANTTFQDISGQGFDAMDRPTAKLHRVYSSGSEAVSQETLTYDATADSTGYLSSDCSQLSECKSYAYDAAGHLSNITFSGNTTPNRSYLYDPDGRQGQITSTMFGTQTYEYDSDGRIIKSVEPTGGGVTSPATLTYHYYPSGLRSSLDVSSAALNVSSLFSYSYRNDGLIQQEQINWGGSNDLNYSYSPAGRVQARTETGPAANGTASKYSYDATGLLTGISYPGGSFAQIEHDAVGNLLGYNVTSYALATGAPYEENSWNVVHQYDLRGHLTDSSVSGEKIWYADDTRVDIQRGMQNLSWSGPMGLALSYSNVWYSSSSSGGVTCKTSHNSSMSTAFDGDGRQTSSSNASSTYDDCNGNGSDGGSSTSYSFDSENHTLQADAATYQWGPNEHPIRIGTTSNGVASYDTVHWDGDQVLFTTNPSGGLDDIKIGTLGDITPNDSGYAGITFWDREPGGLVAYCHNATGYGGSGASSDSFVSYTNPKTGIVTPRSPCALSGTAASTYVPMKYPTHIAWNGTYPNHAANWPTVGNGWTLGYLRPDGIMDGYTTIQGARSYDGVSIAWTTPDPYSGEVTDPSSQRPYMWNHNNPVTYEDPSGYCLEDFCAGETVVAATAGELLLDAGAVAMEDAGETGAASALRGLSANLKRAEWQAFERMGGWAKETFRVNGRTRIADMMDHVNKLIGEAKYVAKQSLTQQLRDYVDQAAKMGYKFVLRVRADTKLSKPLQELVDEGKIILERVPEPQPAAPPPVPHPK